MYSEVRSSLVLHQFRCRNLPKSIQNLPRTPQETLQKRTQKGQRPQWLWRIAQGDCRGLGVLLGNLWHGAFRGMKHPTVCLFFESFFGLVIFVNMPHATHVRCVRWHYFDVFFLFSGLLKAIISKFWDQTRHQRLVFSMVLSVVLPRSDQRNFPRQGDCLYGRPKRKAHRDQRFFPFIACFRYHVFDPNIIRSNKRHVFLKSKSSNIQQILLDSCS